MYSPSQPYNDLPPLPPKEELENKRVLKATVLARAALAELKGVAESIPNQHIFINAITLQEAKASSEVENIITTNDRLYQAFSTSSLEVDQATKEVLRYREALWTGHEALLGKHGIMTVNAFVDIQQRILQHNESVRRLPGTALKNPKGETVYTPPEGEDVILAKLKNLEQFLNDDDMSPFDPLVKMALAHYQFEAIHPFSDGNGRTGRILNVLYLVSKGLLNAPILYLSKYIIDNKLDYYRFLKRVTEQEDWEGWILFLLEAVRETSIQTTQKVRALKELLDWTLEEVKGKRPKIYSKELIESLFEQPYCRIGKLVDNKLASRNTASKYLNQLTEIGVLSLHRVGKESLYMNNRLFELLKDTP
jgi:Fic family protein